MVVAVVAAEWRPEALALGMNCPTMGPRLVGVYPGILDADMYAGKNFISDGLGRLLRLPSLPAGGEGEVDEVVVGVGEGLKGGGLSRDRWVGRDAVVVGTLSIEAGAPLGKVTAAVVVVLVVTGAAAGDPAMSDSSNCVAVVVGRVVASVVVVVAVVASVVPLGSSDSSSETESICNDIKKQNQ